ncbi:MAG: protein kinase, partial [Planctomycetes bacterium]|nr:protein kinase [Planctomycetota bacterium]
MNERDIFLSALEITDRAERAAYVAQACGANAQLRTQVDELLQAHDRNSQFLETPAVGTDSYGQTVVNDTKVDEHGLAGDDTTGEREFRQFLKPAKRPGWLGRLAHYEIESILGRGAFGIVAKAFDEKLHRVVAIKLMNPELASTSPPRKRFLREARTAAAVTHENIVAIYAVEEEPIPYLVMEYIPGQTLQQRLDAQGPLEVSDMLRIGQQVAAGLAAAHAAQLIHRDIKPANILLTGGAQDRAKISDFGLARAVDDATLTSSGLIAGTPMYMAPEQARGEPLDHRADLFSLGSVLYQMASGRPPFRAANTVAVLKRVCEDTPRPLDDVIPGLPGWLQTIIFKLLEKKREDRFQTAQEVADLLARCRSDLEHHRQVTCVPVQAPPVATVVSPAPTVATGNRRRSPAIWLIGCLVGVAGLIGLGTIIAIAGWFMLTPVWTTSSGQSPAGIVSSMPAEPTPDRAPNSISASVENSGGTVDEPPPLADWLKGRNILTVAQDGSGKFNTIQAALEALQAGEVVQVLDRGPYRERLQLQSPPDDIGLISEVQTRIELEQLGPGGHDAAQWGHFFKNANRLRIHGLEFQIPPAPANQVTIGMYFSESRGVVFEQCAVRRPISPESQSLV